MDLARWLESRVEIVSIRWSEALIGEGGGWRGELEPLGRCFFRTLVGFLPGTLTAYRKQMLPVWLSAAELYGSVASRRGLAAGEVIEEFQELRNVLLRLMFEDPPLIDGRRMSMRDLLHLNRLIDKGVTTASVGHTDLLFFSLIHGSGVPSPLQSGDVAALEEQLAGFAEEGARIMRHLAASDRT